MAPEHRLSLQLKRDLLWEANQDVCAELDELSSMDYIDIMDENDVLLSHKWAFDPACPKALEFSDWASVRTQVLGLD